MKMKAIQLKDDGDGSFELVAAFRFERNEELSPDDGATLEDIMREAQERLGSRDTTEETDADTKSTSSRKARGVKSTGEDTASDEGSSGGGKRRRSRGGSKSDVGADASAGTSGRRSRRRKAAEGSDSDGDAPDAAVDDKPASGRRRGRPSSASKEDAGGTSSRRRRGRAAKQPDEQGDASKDAIKDRDLTKAASEAALVITPDGVNDIMTSFEVSDLKDIPPEQRRDFLDKLDAAVNEEE